MESGSKPYKSLIPFFPSKRQGFSVYLWLSWNSQRANASAFPRLGLTAGTTPPHRHHTCVISSTRTVLISFHPVFSPPTLSIIYSLWESSLFKTTNPTPCPPLYCGHILLQSAFTPTSEVTVNFQSQYFKCPKSKDSLLTVTSIKS